MASMVGRQGEGRGIGRAQAAPRELDNPKICAKCGQKGSGPYLRWVRNKKGKRYWYAYFAHPQGKHNKIRWCYIGRLSNFNLSPEPEPAPVPWKGPEGVTVVRSDRISWQRYRGACLGRAYPATGKIDIYLQSILKGSGAYLHAYPGRFDAVDLFIRLLNEVVVHELVHVTGEVAHVHGRRSAWHYASNRAFDEVLDVMGHGIMNELRQLPLPSPPARWVLTCPKCGMKWYRVKPHPHCLCRECRTPLTYQRLGVNEK